MSKIYHHRYSDYTPYKHKALEHFLDWYLPKVSKNHFVIEATAGYGCAGGNVGSPIITLAKCEKYGKTTLDLIERHEITYEHMMSLVKAFGPTETTVVGHCGDNKDVLPKLLTRYARGLVFFDETPPDFAFLRKLRRDLPYIGILQTYMENKRGCKYKGTATQQLKSVDPVWYRNPYGEQAAKNGLPNIAKWCMAYSPGLNGPRYPKGMVFTRIP